MKKRFPRSSGRFRLLLFFAVLCMAISGTINAQTTCGTATTLSSNDTNMLAQSSSATERWYKFTGASLAYCNIWLYNNDATGFTALTLYSGSCTSLTSVATSTQVGDAINVNYSSVVNGTVYYLKASRAVTTSVTYGFNIQFSTASITPCVCPVSLYDPNNTCEGICNGGFEYHTGTLNNWNQVGLACPWSSAPNNTPTPYLGSSTTDLFSANSTNSALDVPYNAGGYQQSHSNPASSTAGYAGIICWTNHSLYPANYREYLEAPLQYTLTAGQSYHLSFWICLAENSGATINKIGAFVTSGLAYQAVPFTYIPIPTGAQNIMYTPSMVDTNWIQVQGNITAVGGEDRIVIGQFFSNATSMVSVHTPVYSATAMPNHAYYFIDDVSLTPNTSISFSSSPNPACTGTALSVTAYSALSGGNYSWTASSGSFSCTTAPCPTFTTTATGATYTVTTTLPTYGSCTISASYTPPTLAGPTNVNAGVDQTVCIGGTATLSGSVSGTYTTTSWANVNGTPVCSSCTSATVTVTANAQYVFTATNATTGCVRRDTMKITAFATPLQITSTSGIVTCDANPIVFTTTPGGFSTYSWATSAPTYSGQTTSTLTATWGSAYSLAGWVKVTAVSASGCIAKDSIVVPSCCKGLNAITNSSTSANLGWFTLSSGYYKATSNFDIAGIYHIDVNTLFQGCTLRLAPNTKIIVDPGIKLQLDNTIIYACNDMWDGIYVDGTNSVSEVIVIHNTVIEDAKNAIVSTAGGKFTIDGSAGRVKMNKNNIGVLVKPYQSVHPGTIKKTTISCDAPGQAGATTGVTSAGGNCKGPISAKAYCAVFIDSCAIITIGDSSAIGNRNLFERQRYGVYAKNSNVNVWNNDFRYHAAALPVNHNSPIEGIAVYAKGYSTLNRTLTVGRPGTYKAHNKIVKADYGVMVENHMNLKCEYNRIDSISTIGVYALNNSIGRTILINKDSITEFSGTGINCTNVLNSTVTITNNQLNETSSSAPTSFGLTGIYVANALPFTSTVLIQTNTIKRIRNGIWVLNITRAQVLDNPITFYATQNFTTALPAIGIKMEAAHNALVKNNSIVNILSGSPLTSVYDKIFGISVTNCGNDTITKNTVQKCGSGIYLKGTDNPILIGCNTLTNNVYGVNYGYTNSIQTIVNTSTQFDVGSTHTPTGNTWPTQSVTTDVFGKVSPASLKWYYNAASSSPIPPNFSVTGMSVNTTGSANICSSLLSPLSATSMRDALLSSICKTPRTYDTLNTAYHYLDSVYAYRTLKDNPSWTTGLGTADDTYYSSWYSSTASGNVGKLAAVEDSIKARVLTSAATLLASITPNGMPESNRVTLLGIYLDTWAKDSMTLDSITRVNLRVIANQAPITGGIAVYQARVMLFEEIHDSSALRLAQDPITNGIYAPGHIYPNPTTGVMMLDYTLPEGKTGSLQLYDISGRILNSYPLIGSIPIQQFNATDLPAGLYFYTVYVGGAAILSEKLVIIKQE